MDLQEERLYRRSIILKDVGTLCYVLFVYCDNHMNLNCISEECKECTSCQVDMIVLVVMQTRLLHAIAYHLPLWRSAFTRS